MAQAPQGSKQNHVEVSSEAGDRKEQDVDLTTKPDNLIAMPDLIHDKIFGFLGVRDKVQAAQVCSSWQAAVYTPCQWREVKVRLESMNFSEEALTSWKTRKIKHVVVKDSSEGVAGVLQNWPALVSLDFEKHDLPFRRLQEIFRQDFQSVKKLHASVSCGESPNLPSFQGIFQHLPNLENLSFAVDACHDIDKAVAINLKKLKDLSITATDTASECNVDFLCKSGSLQSLLLDSVTLSGVDSWNSCSMILKKLTLQECNLGTAHWTVIISKMSCIEELVLLDCQPEVEDGLVNLSQGLKNLKVLECDSTCGWPRDYNDDVRPFGQMSHVQKLSLTGFNFQSGLMKALRCGLKNLRSLTIIDPGSFSAEDMNNISGMPYLQEFSLCNSDVEGSALKILQEGSCKLRTLTLNHCSGTRSEDMKHVAAMSSLCEVMLWDVDLGSIGMNYLTQGTFRLEALDVVRCGIHVQDLQLLLEKQQSLQSLYALGCVKTEKDKLEAKALIDRYSFLKKCSIH